MITQNKIPAPNFKKIIAKKENVLVPYKIIYMRFFSMGELMVHFAGKVTLILHYLCFLKIY